MQITHKSQYACVAYCKIFLVMYMERLKDLREGKNLTQTELAKMLSVSQTTYSRYETGELNIPIVSLKILAKFYCTSIDYLVGLTDVKEPYKRKV